MRIELEVAGHEVAFVSINKDDGVETQEEILKHCSYPQLQDTEELALWKRLGGGKDDFYIFDAEGELQTYLRFHGSVSTTLAEPEDYQHVKDAILAVIEGQTAADDPDAEAAPDAPLDPADSADDAGPELDTSLELDTSPALDTADSEAPAAD